MDPLEIKFYFCGFLLEVMNCQFRLNENLILSYFCVCVCGVGREITINVQDCNQFRTV